MQDKKVKIMTVGHIHKIEYIKRYKKANMKGYCLLLSKIYEQDIIDYLNAQDNKSETIKKALRAQMQKKN
jgi:hypothetical protein